MIQAPRLPREYRLLAHERLPDASVEAIRLARAGAEEGTLVWAREQSAGRARLGRAWLASPGDLHCALVLRPEVERAQALQLVYVAALSLGATLAQAVSPMTVLHYRWPNDVLLRHAKVAGIQLAGGDGEDGSPWLVLAVNANVKGVADALSLSAAAVEVDGECSTDAALLLEDFCRYFLRTINRWADSGFAPLLEAWRNRVPDLGQYVRIALPGRECAGLLSAVDERGDALLEINGEQVKISLETFFGLDDG